MSRHALRFACLVAALLAPATPAAGAALAIDLTISFNDALGAGSTLTGTASLFHQSLVSIGDGGTLIIITPAVPDVPVGPLTPGHGFAATLLPPNPCFGDGSCQVNFKFGGLVSGFDTFAFALLSDAGTKPPGPPTIPIGILPPSPARFSGPIVTFDDPIQVGEWDITLRAVSTPLPPPLALFPAGAGLLAWLGRRRKRHTSR